MKTRTYGTSPKTYCTFSPSINQYFPPAFPPLHEVGALPSLPHFLLIDKAGVLLHRRRPREEKDPIPLGGGRRTESRPGPHGELRLTSSLVTLRLLQGSHR